MFPFHNSACWATPKLLVFYKPKVNLSIEYWLTQGHANPCLCDVIVALCANGINSSSWTGAGYGLNDCTHQFAAAGKTFCKKSQCSWEAGNSLGVLAQIPLLNTASFLLICLQENAILQAQARNFADIETCGIFPVGMSSQNGRGRRNPSWLVWVLACILSSSLQCLSEGLACCAGLCLGEGFVWHWVTKLVAECIKLSCCQIQPSFAPLPGLTCAPGISVALAVQMQPVLDYLCLKHTVIQPVNNFIGFRYSV